nr:MAG TPA: YjcQ protein [Caudoviricetes sp.]
MRLNFDLIRELLLAIESNSTIDKGVRFIDLSEKAAATAAIFGEAFPPLLPKYQQDLQVQYSFEEIFYHLNYLIENELVYPSISSESPNILIPDLTPKGHDYINLVREKNYWEKLKAFVSDIKQPITTDIILSLGKELIKQAIGL